MKDITELVRRAPAGLKRFYLVEDSTVDGSVLEAFFQDPERVLMCNGYRLFVQGECWVKRRVNV